MKIRISNTEAESVDVHLRRNKISVQYKIFWYSFMHSNFEYEDFVLTMILIVLEKMSSTFLLPNKILRVLGFLTVIFFNHENLEGVAMKQ